MKRLMLIVLLLLVTLAVSSQSVVYPFECLPELELDHIAARSIWVGYANGGWDVPDDTRFHSRYNEKFIDTYRVYHSVSANEYYLFVYDTLPVDEGHAYLSWHPCGQGAISPTQYKQVTGEYGNTSD